MPYSLQVPARLPPAAGYPLWVFLHGAFATVAQGLALFGSAADANAAVLLVPQATRPCGEGFCWSFARDAAAIRALLAQVCASYPIDQRRIAVIGYSMGCTMGLWLLAQQPTTFATFAALAMGSAFEPWEHDDGGIDRLGLQHSARTTRLLLVVDQDDPAGTNASFAANVVHLQAAGFDLVTLRPTAATHEVTADMHAAVLHHLRSG